MSNCWTIIKRKTLDLTNKDTPHPKTKVKLQWDARRGTITIKSNPITAGWATHKLENSYTTEVHLSPSGFPTWGSGNGRRNYKRIRLWRPAGFDCRTSTGLGETETPLLESIHKVVCTSGPRGKEKWLHRTPKQTNLLVLEGLLQKQGVAVAYGRDKDTGSRSSGRYSLAWASPEATISSTKEPVVSSSGLPQGKQPAGRELSPTHKQTSGLKIYWALPTRATPSSTHHQSLPSGSLHKRLR